MKIIKANGTFTIFILAILMVSCSKDPDPDLLLGNQVGIYEGMNNNYAQKVVLREIQ